MQSSMLALVAFAMLLAFVQCANEKTTTDYEIKQSM